MRLLVPVARAAPEPITCRIRRVCARACGTSSTLHTTSTTTPVRVFMVLPQLALNDVRRIASGRGLFGTHDDLPLGGCDGGGAAAPRWRRIHWGGRDASGAASIQPQDRAVTAGR